jgi:RND family efflux transporter MFP subunit
MNALLRRSLLVAALLASVLVSGCGGKAGDAATRAAAAPDTALLASEDVAPVERMDLSAGVPVSGTLTPGWQARVTSPLDDVVQDVLVREGQRVTQGQELARFRQGSVEADAASARAHLKSAASDWERQKNLFAEGAVSARDVEVAEAAYRAAQAQDAAASRRLGDATVRAPGAGVVSTRSVQSGDRVATGDPLFVISDTRTLEFEATVPTEFVSRVRPGSEVVLTATGMPAGSIHGRVARVNTTADEATRQVKVYAEVPNGNGRLVGDLFASGTIVVEQVPHAIAVPTAAVRHEGATTFVWVLGPDGRLARHDVKAGLRDEARDRVQVAGGLSEGERVLVGPVEGLVAGQVARVTGKES